MIRCIALLVMCGGWHAHAAVCVGMRLRAAYQCPTMCRNERGVGWTLAVVAMHRWG